MEFLFYYASAFLAFLGLPIGAILAFISPEEMPTGKKYFPLVQQASLLAAAVFFVNAFAIGLHWRILVYALAIICTFLIRKTHINYIALALLLFFSAPYPEAFLSIAILTFVYGLPSGSLYASAKRRKRERILLSVTITHIHFLALAFLLPLFRNFF